MTTAQIPPPPGRENFPDPPPYGWIGDPNALTGHELDEIARRLGADPQRNRGRLIMHAAVALARRSDPDRYPWDLADLLTLAEVEVPSHEAPDPT